MHDDLGRALQGLTIGVVRDAARLDANRRSLGMRETTQQFQIPVSGQAGTAVAWSSTTVSFDAPFSVAPGQRDSDLELPQMTYGAHLELGPVMLSAHVSGWQFDDDQSVTAATIEIGTHAPGATAPVDFTGFVHATFEGWAALHEDETEMA